MTRPEELHDCFWRNPSCRVEVPRHHVALKVTSQPHVSLYFCSASSFGIRGPAKQRPRLSKVSSGLLQGNLHALHSALSLLSTCTSSLSYSIARKFDSVTARRSCTKPKHTTRTREVWCCTIQRLRVTPAAIVPHSFHPKSTPTEHHDQYIRQRCRDIPACGRTRSLRYTLQAPERLPPVCRFIRFDTAAAAVYILSRNIR